MCKEQQINMPNYGKKTLILVGNLNGSQFEKSKLNKLIQGNIMLFIKSNQIDTLYWVLKQKTLRKIEITQVEFILNSFMALFVCNIYDITYLNHE